MLQGRTVETKVEYASSFVVHRKRLDKVPPLHFCPAIAPTLTLSISHSQPLQQYLCSIFNSWEDILVRFHLYHHIFADTSPHRKIHRSTTNKVPLRYRSLSNGRPTAQRKHSSQTLSPTVQLHNFHHNQYQTRKNGHSIKSNRLRTHPAHRPIPPQHTRGLLRPHRIHALAQTAPSKLRARHQMRDRQASRTYKERRCAFSSPFPFYFYFGLLDFLVSCQVL